MSNATTTAKPSATMADFWREFSGVFGRFQEVWSILGAKEKLLLRLSFLPMILYAAVQNAIPILAGWMVDQLRISQQAGTIRNEWFGIAAKFVILIAVLALLRELFFLARKRLVGNVCSRVERSLTIGLVSHLFRQSLQSLSKDHVGTVHGRATRGIAGFIHFIKLVFREFLPAVFAISIALVYAIFCSPMIGLLLIVALIASLALVSIQLRAQKGMYAELGEKPG